MIIIKISQLKEKYLSQENFQIIEKKKVSSVDITFSDTIL